MYGMRFGPLGGQPDRCTQMCALWGGASFAIALFDFKITCPADNGDYFLPAGISSARDLHNHAVGNRGRHDFLWHTVLLEQW